MRIHFKFGQEAPALAHRNEREVKRRESADKPDSVEDSHSSGPPVTSRLKQPTRVQRGPRHWTPIWSCSGWGLPCHRLLPGTRCALTAPFHPYLRPFPFCSCFQSQLGQATSAVSFCCTFHRLAPSRRYLAPCPMESGLSSSTLRHQRLSGRLPAAILAESRQRPQREFLLATRIVQKVSASLTTDGNTGAYSDSFARKVFSNASAAAGAYGSAGTLPHTGAGHAASPTLRTM